MGVLRRQREDGARLQYLAFRGFKLFPHGVPKAATHHGDDLGIGMSVRRNFIIRREFHPLDRVDLSQRSKLNFKNDGSLDLYIQKDSPGKDKEANWLPSAEGDFGLILRLYWPNEKAPSILDGSWMPPSVRAVK